MSKQESYTDELAQHLADRMIPLETAEETIARIKKYADNGFVPADTRLALILAAIRKWEGSTG